jgi:hypothetical protein
VLAKDPPDLLRKPLVTGRLPLVAVLLRLQPIRAGSRFRWFAHRDAIPKVGFAARRLLIDGDPGKPVASSYQKAVAGGRSPKTAGAPGSGKSCGTVRAK